jgi:hypothetical protein
VFSRARCFLVPQAPCYAGFLALSPSGSIRSDLRAASLHDHEVRPNRSVLALQAAVRMCLAWASAFEKTEQIKRVKVKARRLESLERAEKPLQRNVRWWPNGRV